MSSKYSAKTAKASFKSNATRAALHIVALTVPLSLGCSTDSPGEPSGDAGASLGGASGSAGAAKGGSLAQGGTVSSGAPAGGTNSTGGASGSTGGVPSTGGTGSGGVMSTGGTTAGGTTANGGMAAGGATSMGGMAAGGAMSEGGMSTGGAMTAGSSQGGAAGSSAGASGGGAAGASGSGSPGCGIASPLTTGNFTESIGGTSRKWMLDVPAGYDPSKPYRLIFVWHPLGGSGSQVVSGGFNGLKSLSGGTAIFATADGLNGSNSEASGTGWWNANGGDMQLVKLMLDKINAGLCVDQERIFSTGFSFGGMMSYTLPFEFDVFRAVAPSSGKDGVIPHEKTFDRPIPIMAFHGNNDTFVLTSLGRDFFDDYRTGRNQCDNQTQPVAPSPCVQYQGCDAPATWCEFPGGHEMWSQAPQAIWQFFSQF